MKYGMLVLALIFGHVTIFVCNTSAQTADFTGTPRTGEAPLTVRFNSSINVPGAITAILWRFGDGGESRIEDPTHTYKKAGTYSVELKVLYAGGGRYPTKEDYIIITDPTKVYEPIISPSPGNYVGPVNVTISCILEDAIIYYTTDGTDPKVGPAELYSRSISIEDTTTLKAYAKKDGLESSDVVVGQYNISKNYAPTFNPAPGDYYKLVNVAINSVEENAVIYYTIDGTNPKVGDARVYTTPITIEDTTTIKAYAGKDGQVPSDVVVGQYNISKNYAPTFNPAPGDYNNLINVAINSIEENAVIYYTIDGTNPKVGDALVYTSPITTTDTTTINAYAKKDGLDPTEVVIGQYNVVPAPIKVSTPIFSPAPGNYPEQVDVTISCITEDATIYYTTDGTNPKTGNAELYSSPVAIEDTTTLKAYARKTGDWSSDIVVGKYNVHSLTGISNPSRRDGLGSVSELQQNYPNPFRASTTIEYYLAQRGKVALVVYDLFGRNVKTLFDGHQQPGTHTAQFDARGLPVGMYRVVLRGNRGTQSRMLVVR
jgi:PKD repeat protein